ncbi:MAG: cytochrome b/b6 domain-containing protein [Novosphingobium sp.]
MTERSTAIKRSKLTRVLHWLTALAIVTQLGLSLVMQSPGRNRPGDALFEVHEKVGIAATAILIAFWIWSIARSGETRIAAFIPWFSVRQLKLVWADARNLFGTVHEGGRERPFASAVHGLGLIVATIMALSGLLGYFVTPARSLLGVHEAIAPLMWAYLIGHVAISIVHELRGERIIRSMLSLSDRG